MSIEGELAVSARALLLLGAANAAPILATRLLGSRLDRSVDGGLCFLDGRPLLGASKTIRGLVVSLVATSLLAPILGFDWSTGVGIAALSMLGDLLSSFLKRRMGLPAHAQALGLDQIPEALLPLLVYADALGLDAAGVAVTVALFLGLELVLSRLLYRLRFRDQPY